MLVGGGERHDGVERMLEAAAVFAAGTRSQAPMSPGQHHGPQQQRLHAWGEDGVARLDGVAAVAELMRQADLPLGGMTLLGTVEIRDPDRRAVTIQHFPDDGRTTAA